MPPTISLGPFQFTSVGVQISGRPQLDQWKGPLQFALWCQRAGPWWIGDLLNHGEDHFGESFSQMCEGVVSTEQLSRYASVARRVPMETDLLRFPGQPTQSLPDFLMINSETCCARPKIAAGPARNSAKRFKNGSAMPTKRIAESRLDPWDRHHGGNQQFNVQATCGRPSMGRYSPGHVRRLEPGL